MLAAVGVAVVIAFVLGSKTVGDYMGHGPVAGDQYNFVALMIPLATWEAVTLQRLPVLSALATGAVALLATGSAAISAGGAWSLGPQAVSGLSIGCTMALGCYLAYRIFNSRSRPARGTPLPFALGNARSVG